MVRKAPKLQLPVTINKFEFDNIQTGYTPKVGVDRTLFFNTTENWKNLKTPSPLNMDNVEFIIFHDGSDSNRFPEALHLPQHTHFFHQDSPSQCSSPVSEANSKSSVKRTKQFTCEFCQKSFYRRDELKRHERIHTGERPLACMYCDKRFMRSDHRATHHRIHTGERPYQCVYCIRTFSRSDERLRHMRMSHF